LTNIRAMARPMPEEAPVTMAFLPLNMPTLSAAAAAAAVRLLSTFSSLTVDCALLIN
jgi:hypothetical protein